jgi:hypothetical protein
MEKDACDDRAEFAELLRFTVAGYAGGIALAAALDWLGFQQSAWGQWGVRTLAGEGESLGEGAFAALRRLRGEEASFAEAYGWGKMAGMIFPWFVDLGSRLAGVQVNAPEGFYLPFLYAMSDQIGAVVAGLLYELRTAESWQAGLLAFARNPVMITSVALIVAVPVGIFLARSAGFAPETQLLTALEMVVANLCWLPPLVGLLTSREECSKEPSEGTLG